MATVDDLVFSPDGELIGRYRVRLGHRAAENLCGIAFDDDGVAEVGPDQSAQLRRILLAGGDAMQVEPLDLDAIRAAVDEPRILDAIERGATWPSFLVGEATVRRHVEEGRTARAAEDRAEAQANAPSKPTGQPGAAAGQSYDEAAELHAARVRGTQVYELFYEARQLGISTSGLWNRPRAELAELILSAHGWPHRFPRAWRPSPGITRETARSEELAPLPYDPGDVLVAPEREALDS